MEEQRKGTGKREKNRMWLLLTQQHAGVVCSCQQQLVRAQRETEKQESWRNRERSSQTERDKELESRDRETERQRES